MGMTYTCYVHVGMAYTAKVVAVSKTSQPTWTDDANFPPNGLGCEGMVPCHHDYLKINM